MVWVYILISLLAGALMPLQAGVNAQLSRWGGSTPAAALVSFAVGALGLFAYCAMLRTQVGAWGALASSPWWVWVGGLLGAGAVTAAASLAPRRGAPTFISLTIAGQSVIAILIPPVR